MSIIGFIEAGAQIGVQFVQGGSQRGLYTSDDQSAVQIVKQITIEEVHTDEMEITDHPVEQGTTISDHAFARPAELVITAGWSNSPNDASVLSTIAGAASTFSSAARAVIGVAQAGSAALTLLSGGQPAAVTAYSQLIAVQKQRRLFDIYTGKRVYKNMLIQALSSTTSKETENVLIVRITCRQILMAQTQTVTVPSSANMADPANTASPGDGSVVVNAVPAPNINVSALP